MNNGSHNGDFTIAYLANQFPVSVEPYVEEEIRELRGRGIAVIPCSVKRPARDVAAQRWIVETMYLQPFRAALPVQAMRLCVRERDRLAPFLNRALFRGRERAGARLRALLHTWAGVCFALLLKERRVQHIHVHHGYAAAWIAMVAARLLKISYSLTLHGSDLLVHGRFLDIKLEHCQFCLTVSEYNLAFLLARYPHIDRNRVRVQRMGVQVPQLPPAAPANPFERRSCFVMLAVGRLHPVKDHAFLIAACAELKRLGTKFICLIAGDGPERRRLERLIAVYGLTAEVRLLGHVQREDLAAQYALADLVVLTSRSEGLPLTLMEAMAHGKPVLAPAITGVPELVMDGQTGFLYQPGSLEDFVQKAGMIRCNASSLGPMRRAAREHVRTYFESETNLRRFADLFVAQLEGAKGSQPSENSLHQ